MIEYTPSRDFPEILESIQTHIQDGNVTDYVLYRSIADVYTAFGSVYPSYPGGIVADLRNGREVLLVHFRKDDYTESNVEITDRLLDEEVAVGFYSEDGITYSSWKWEENNEYTELSDIERNQVMQDVYNSALLLSPFPPPSR